MTDVQAMSIIAEAMGGETGQALKTKLSAWKWAEEQALYANREALTEAQALIGFGRLSMIYDIFNRLEAARATTETVRDMQKQR